MDDLYKISPARIMTNEPTRRFVLLFLLALILIGLTATAYVRVLDCGFVSYDDEEYVTKNAVIKHGLSLEGLSYAFTNTDSGNWHPLTWLSHMVDCQLFGLNPRGHHLTNLILHVGNALLLFYILLQMTGATWRSFLVAALFGVHPLHVESVAWISERKDVLSTFFWMLTMGAYVRYVECPSSKSRYLTVALMLALGLMAKAMLVTLPCVLLLLDFWPLGRFQLWRQKANVVQPNGKTSLPERTNTPVSTLLREKIPFFLLIAVLSVVTYTAQKTVGAMSFLPVPVRISNALAAYVLYVWKIVWPHNLIFFYPHPYHVLPLVWIVGAGIALVAATVFSFLMARRAPYVLVGWLWYVGTLVPVIGLVQVGSQSMADRYTYVPSIGLFIVGVWSVADISTKWRYRPAVVGIVSAVLLLTLAVKTRIQTGYWKNDDLLYGHAVEVDENNYVAHLNIGGTLLKKGRYEEAFNHFTRALQIRPNSAEAYHNLGMVLERLGKEQVAIECYEKAIQLEPNLAQPHFVLGVALLKQKQFDEAIRQLYEAVRLKPDSTEAHETLGNLLGSQGRFSEAIDQLYEVLRTKPNDSQAHYRLAVALEREGRFTDAGKEYVEALRIDPKSAQAHNGLGSILARYGKLEEAEAHFSEATLLQPGYEKAQHNLEKVKVRLKEVRKEQDAREVVR